LGFRNGENARFYQFGASNKINMVRFTNDDEDISSDVLRLAFGFLGHTA
jgi:hypothetical protein